jgi:hypothetical protein
VKPQTCGERSPSTLARDGPSTCAASTFARHGPSTVARDGERKSNHERESNRRDGERQSNHERKSNRRTMNADEHRLTSNGVSSRSRLKIARRGWMSRSDGVGRGIYLSRQTG